MTLPRAFATPASTAMALALAASVLAGCAGGSRRRPAADHSSTGVVVSSPRWLNSALTEPESGPSSTSERAYVTNPALKRSEPWLGTIGLRQQFSDSYEVGVGLAVPNPFPGDAPSAVADERARDIGIGVWLTFDF